jgi:hypothetical protein
MDRKELEQSWATTRRHLGAAMRLLPTESPTDDIAQSRARYQDWLDHNELELALDELIFIAEEVLARGERPSSNVWSELSGAALSMALEEKAALCRLRLTE